MSRGARKWIPCPRCGKLALLGAENKWRPFCSERCKLIDLGNWASERCHLPEPETPSENNEPSDR